MKITKKQLLQVIKEEISEVSRGLRNVTPEPTAKGLQAVDPKMSNYGMTAGEKRMARQETESSGKFNMVRTPDGVTLSLGKNVMEDFDNHPDAPHDFTGQLKVFSVKSDKQIGVLTVKHGKAVSYEEKAGKKYTSEISDDEESDEELEEALNTMNEARPTYLGDWAEMFKTMSAQEIEKVLLNLAGLLKQQDKGLAVLLSQASKASAPKQPVAEK